MAEEVHLNLKEKEFVVTPPEFFLIILSFIQWYVWDFLKIKIHARLPKVREKCIFYLMISITWHLDYWVFSPQELHTAQYEIMSSASFSLTSVWLVNPIKIRREEARVRSGVNIEYVSDDQMASDVINGADRSFWSSIYIWFCTFFQLMQV